jgi:hypothetical protein
MVKASIYAALSFAISEMFHHAKQVHAGATSWEALMRAKDAAGEQVRHVARLETEHQRLIEKHESTGRGLAAFVVVMQYLCSESLRLTVSARNTMQILDTDGSVLHEADTIYTLAQWCRAQQYTPVGPRFGDHMARQ